jgi:regulator of sigma E protease
MNTAIGIVLVLGVIILVHEWGHFIMARIFGVRVDVFSIGFGPRVFGIKRGATDWRLSAVPLGGYVRMAGQDITEVDSGDQAPTGAPDELMSKKRWQRALISFAGPAINLIFPVLLLGFFYLVVGVPYAAFERKPVVVNEFSAPQVALPNGLESGDKLLSLDGFKNPTWEDTGRIMAHATPGTRFRAEVESGGVTRQVQIVSSEDPRAHSFGYLPIRPVISEVGSGTPASHAGLQDGDVVHSIDGQRVDYWDQFVDVVRNSRGKPLQLVVSRKGQDVNLTVTPKQGIADSAETNYQIGVTPYFETAYDRVGFVTGFKASLNKTRDYITDTLGIVGKLFSGRVSVKQLQSVVGISHVAGQAVSQGPVAVISLMALISVNLGILNLLPIPILDGGHILLLSLEGIRRRDFSLTFKERFIQVGLVFLLVLFVYVMYNDVVRLLPSHS